MYVQYRRMPVSEWCNYEVTLFEFIVVTSVVSDCCDDV